MKIFIFELCLAKLSVSKHNILLHHQCNSLYCTLGCCKKQVRDYLIGILMMLSLFYLHAAIWLLVILRFERFSPELFFNYIVILN